MNFLENDKEQNQSLSNSFNKEGHRENGYASNKHKNHSSEKDVGGDVYLLCLFFFSQFLCTGQFGRSSKPTSLSQVATKCLNVQAAENQRFLSQANY